MISVGLNGGYDSVEYRYSCWKDAKVITVSFRVVGVTVDHELTVAEAVKLAKELMGKARSVDPDIDEEDEE